MLFFFVRITSFEFSGYSDFCHSLIWPNHNLLWDTFSGIYATPFSFYSGISFEIILVHFCTYYLPCDLFTCIHACLDQSLPNGQFIEWIPTCRHILPVNVDNFTIRYLRKIGHLTFLEIRSLRTFSNSISE